MILLYLVSFLFSSSAATYYSVDKYIELKDDPTANEDIKFVASLDYYKNLSKTWLALGELYCLERGSSVVECRTHNRESPDVNLPFATVA